MEGTGLPRKRVANTKLMRNPGMLFHDPYLRLRDVLFEVQNKSRAS
jgi:hypothetical protein